MILSTMRQEPEIGHEIDTDLHRLGLDGNERPRRLHAELTQAITGAAFEVHKELSHGFLEKVYVSALRAELTRRSIAVQAETPIEVFYKGSPVGLYYADLLIRAQCFARSRRLEDLLRNTKLSS